MKLSRILTRMLPESTRALVRRRMVGVAMSLLKPMDLVSRSDDYSWSAAGRTWNTQVARGIGGWLEVPNHSQGYHGLLRQWWTAYGLGASSLLVSESSEARNCLSRLYPETRMVATDYYLDLSPEQESTDVVWDLYAAAPDALASTLFGSVICQATFEHLVDPIGVLRKLVGLLQDGGHLYLHTHTPLFPYHGWPNDYVRFFPDWFRDVGLVIPEIEAIEIYCGRGHAFAAYRKRVAATTEGCTASAGTLP